MLLILLIGAILFIIVGTTRFQLHPFLTLLLAAIAFGLCAGMPVQSLIDSIGEGFGKTLGSIGPVIILGVIIGSFLEHSGGAFQLATKVLQWIGAKRVTLAMGLMGFIVSIPVFADSGFMLLASLNKALTKKAGKTLAATAIALAMGLMASHVMVPPTPGPVAATGIIGADMGLVIFWGILIGLLSLIPCILFAEKAASKVYIDPIPDTTDLENEKTHEYAPGPLLAFLPILAPILLIVLRSFNESMHFATNVFFKNVIDFAGAPVIALLIGVGLSLVLPQKLERQMLSDTGWVGKAIKDAAVIIIITGAGGIFGKVLQNSGLPDAITTAFGEFNGGVWLPFLVAAALKTAQGSSTVAIITTASIVAPLLGGLHLDTETSKALTVIAIGAGSTVVSHANDSFFWVVTQMSGMNTGQGYRLHTVGSGILGLTAGILIYLLSILL